MDIQIKDNKTHAPLKKQMVSPETRRNEPKICVNQYL